jgi:hypothetical protein
LDLEKISSVLVRVETSVLEKEPCVDEFTKPLNPFFWSLRINQDWHKQHETYPVSMLLPPVTFALKTWPLVAMLVD